MDQSTKKKLVDRAETKSRLTYHGADGRFSNAMSAATATRDGERLKIVRQLRRLKRKGAKVEERDKFQQLVLRTNLARQKAALRGLLSAPGFIQVGDL